MAIYHFCKNKIDYTDKIKSDNSLLQELFFELISEKVKEISSLLNLQIAAKKITRPRQYLFLRAVAARRREQHTLYCKRMSNVQSRPTVAHVLLHLIARPTKRSIVTKHCADEVAARPLITSNQTAFFASIFLPSCVYVYVSGTEKNQKAQTHICSAQ